MYNYSNIKTVDLKVTQNGQASCPMRDRNMNGSSPGKNVKLIME
jgi:hypothetical protein|tara:strand:+ start:403 stop:534 length:132 start_codon:yes stop_codon:yes gene_type:complete